MGGEAGAGRRNRRGSPVASEGAPKRLSLASPVSDFPVDLPTSGRERSPPPPQRAVAGCWCRENVLRVPELLRPPGRSGRVVAGDRAILSQFSGSALAPP